MFEKNEMTVLDVFNSTKKWEQTNLVIGDVLSNNEGPNGWNYSTFINEPYLSHLVLLVEIWHKQIFILTSLSGFYLNLSIVFDKIWFNNYQFQIEKYRDHILPSPINSKISFIFYVQISSD